MGGFLGGILTGLVIVVVVLVPISLLAPLPQPPAGAQTEETGSGTAAAPPVGENASSATRSATGSEAGR